MVNNGNIRFHNNSINWFCYDLSLSVYVLKAHYYPTRTQFSLKTKIKNCRHSSMSFCKLYMKLLNVSHYLSHVLEIKKSSNIPTLNILTDSIRPFSHGTLLLLATGTLNTFPHFLSLFTSLKHPIPKYHSRATEVGPRGRVLLAAVLDPLLQNSPRNHTTILFYRFGLGKDDCARYISTLPLQGTPLSSACWAPQVAACNARAKFRSVDGSCNNVDNPSWGSAMTAYTRILFPRYFDGKDSPYRVTFKG